ncbi:DUF4249 domain-containing protein [Dyadobacter soli]|nr:DUF4249 domain-containing protein [Dyadobacter soli]
MALIVGCESMVTNISPSKLPKAGSKLVVQSFISPQAEYINVLVTESLPLFHRSNASVESIEDATVKISDDAHEAIVPFNETTKTYTLPADKFTILAGGTYHLEVSHGVRVVKAQCKVPGVTPVINSYEISPLEARHHKLDGIELVQLNMNWKDTPGEKNYYRTNAYMTIEHSVGDGFVNGKETEKRMTSRLGFYWDRHSVNKELQQDQDLDGTTFFSPPGQLAMPTPRTYSDGVESQVKPKPTLKSITIELFNTDENYFKYHHSLDEREDNANPFTEPYLIFTNIEGGLGCFGAYNAGKLVYQPE